MPPPHARMGSRGFPGKTSLVPLLPRRWLPDVHEPPSEEQSCGGSHRDSYCSPVLIQQPEDRTDAAGQAVDRLEDRDLPDIRTTFGEDGGPDQHGRATHHEYDVEPPPSHSACRHRRTPLCRRRRSRPMLPPARHAPPGYVRRAVPTRVRTKEAKPTSLTVCWSTTAAPILGEPSCRGSAVGMG